MDLRLFCVVTLSALGLACSSSGSSRGDPCQTGCDKVVALNCGKDNTTTCLAECQSVVTDANKVGCGAQAEAYLDCVVQQPFTCSSTGKATVNKAPCATQDNAVSACEKGDAAPPPIDAATGG